MVAGFGLRGRFDGCRNRRPSTLPPKLSKPPQRPPPSLSTSKVRMSRSTSKATTNTSAGELTSLKIGTVEKSARTSAIFFTSGNVATELTWSDDLVDIIGYKTPAPNRAYEINIEELRAIIE